MNQETYSKGKSVLCPQDGTVLARSRDEGCSALACVTCRGMWLSYELLELVQIQRLFSPEDFVRQMGNSINHVTSLRCPSDCATPLKRAMVSKLELDWCSSCRGVWLDAGELKTLLGRLLPPADGFRSSKTSADDILDGAQALLLAVQIGS